MKFSGVQILNQSVEKALTLLEGFPSFVVQKPQLWVFEVRSQYLEDLASEPWVEVFTVR